MRRYNNMQLKTFPLTMKLPCQKESGTQVSLWGEIEKKLTFKFLYGGLSIL